MLKGSPDQARVSILLETDKIASTSNADIAYLGFELEGNDFKVSNALVNFRIKLFGSVSSAGIQLSSLAWSSENIISED